MTKNIQHIVQENDKRVKEINSEYDPLMGIGSPLDRFPFFITSQQRVPVLLPLSMQSIDLIKNVIDSGCKSAEEFASRSGIRPENYLYQINETRLDHDFEFYCVFTVKIKPKTGGAFIPFILNRAQRKIIKSLEKQRLKGKPIRTVLLKSRQNGGSTVIQIYMSWIQIRLKTNWNSLIAAHINQAATNIRSMLKTVVNNYPLENLSLSPFEGTHNIKIIKQRSNKITIGSMETPDSIRSDDVALFHGSEIGLWKKTDNKKPEDLIQSILGTIPNLPLSMVALESTAKGVGNFFHRTWLEAKRTGVYDPVFVAWWEIEMYQIDFDSEEEKINLIKSMDEYELYLWNLGATLEGIKWYRQKLGEYNGNRVIMCSEFPSDDVEAFQSTGARFFPVSTIQRARRFVKAPLFVGDIHGDALTGPKAMDNIRIEKSNTGNLSVWSMPETFEDKRYLNRYVVSVDIGGRSKDADDSVIKIYDRIWMMDGGIMELAACWAGKIDFDHLAWKAVQLCLLYDRGYMIPEINKMREDTNAFDEGDQFYTLIDEIVEYYDNIFCRTNPEQIRSGMPRAYGFFTSSQTKPMVLNSLNAAYRDDQVANYDIRSMEQADTFEVKGNGKTGAVEGCHDDHVMADAIGVWGGIHHMPPVREVQITAKRSTKKRVMGESTF